MHNGFLDQFPLPDVAREALEQRGYNSVSLGGGVDRIVAEHDANGLAYRFYVHTIYNPVKSKAAKYEVFDEVDMIQWFRDRFDSPVERVSLLPSSLLDLSDPEEPRGRFAESYKRFKEGRRTPGTPLAQWGILTDSQVATLNTRNVFSVEQLAAQSKNKMSALPQEYQEAQERAIQFVNGKEGRFEKDKQAAEIVALSQSNEKLSTQVGELMALVARLTQTSGSDSGDVEKVAPKKRGRPAKIVTGKNIKEELI